MAKHLFFLAAAGALALTACTSEDVVEDVASSRNLITFENVVNKPTRVDDIGTKENPFMYFNVYGFYTLPNNEYVANEVFENVLVSKQTSGTWSYITNEGEKPEGPRYWVPDARYYFYAYSCGNTKILDEEFGSFDLNMKNEYDEGTPDDKKLKASDRVLKITNYICDNSHQHDLIFATNTGGVTGEDKYVGILGKTTQNNAVSLQFYHILSKINAQFTSKFSKEYTLVVKNVSIQNIRNQGNYDPREDKGWESVTRKAGVPHVNLQTGTGLSMGVNESDKTGTAYVIPWDYDKDPNDESTVSIKFDIDLLFQGNLVMNKTLIGTFIPEWKPGFAYTYNIEVSGSTTKLEIITFTTAENPVTGFTQYLTEDEQNPVINITSTGDSTN